MISRIRTLTLVSILVFAGSRGEAIAGRGGFHAGGFGGFHGGGYGGFHAEGAEGFHAGGSGGYHSGGYGGFHAGGAEGFHAGGAEGFHAGGAEGFHAGGYGSSSFGRSSSYGTSRSYGGYSGLHEGAGSNPYAATGTSHRGGEYASGPYGGHYGAGSGSGSYTTQRGGPSTTARRAAARPGLAARRPGAGSTASPGRLRAAALLLTWAALAARWVPGATPSAAARTLVPFRASGTAVGGSREGFASGAGGTAVAGEHSGAAVGAGGGAVAGRSYGAAAVRPYGDAGEFGWHGGSYSGYNSGWVHGYWGGHYGGWGWGGYGGGYGAGLGMGMGLAAWGMGSSLYSGWGYMPYANPYYGAAGAVASPVYNYSQPIDTAAAPPDNSVAAPAMTAFDKARDAFKGGDYASALTLADQAVKSVPGDSAVHEFRAQVLIALGKYDDAAAALYGVLSVGPGWDWTTLISLYPDLETYTAQLRALEKSVRTDPRVGRAAVRAGVPLPDRGPKLGGRRAAQGRHPAPAWRPRVGPAPRVDLQSVRGRGGVRSEPSGGRRGQSPGAAREGREARRHLDGQPRSRIGDHAERCPGRQVHLEGRLRRAVARPFGRVQRMALACSRSSPRGATPRWSARLSGRTTAASSSRPWVEVRGIRA